MRKILFLLILTLIFFLGEFFIANAMGRGWRPNLLLLLIIFTNLYFGIRYGCAVALLAGILNDSFTAGVFGVYIFVFLAAAYLTVYLKKYVYMTGSPFSRLVLVGVICILNFLMLYFLQIMFTPIHFWLALKMMFFPEIVLTMIVSTFIFSKLKSCALKFSV